LSDRLDLLLFHAYFIGQDPREQEIMRPFPPLGLQYLVAWLRREGFPATDCFDATFETGPEAVESAVEDADPRVVGLYGHTLTRAVSAEMVRLFRYSGRRVIAGGPDPVQYLDSYFDMGVEVIVVGEGEQTLTALMEHLRENGWTWRWEALEAIEGIAFRRDGVTVRTAPRSLLRPLDRLPFPYRRRADLDGYFAAWRARHGETAMSLATSRGCPYHCTWCSKQVYGDTFRRRSPADVVDEVIFLRQEFAPDQLWFVDDMFTINRAWVTHFCEEMVARSAVTPFYLIGRPERLDDDVLAQLVKAGLYRMYISAESGAQHVLDAMRRDAQRDAIVSGARRLKRHGVEIGVFSMIGYPGEEAVDIRATAQMLREIDPDVLLLSIAHPMKGTAFYDEVQDRLKYPAGWEQMDGGRLAFSMRYPRPVYDVAQRMIQSQLRLGRKWSRRDLDRELAQLALRAPVYRAVFELMTRGSDWLEA
jgi:radical SAM superfamily enzyme YgiQ (UPF0313 family)